MKPTCERLSCEEDYRLAVSLMQILCDRGLLTAGEFRRAKRELGRRLHPVWGDLPDLEEVARQYQGKHGSPACPEAGPGGQPVQEPDVTTSLQRGVEEP